VNIAGPRSTAYRNGNEKFQNVDEKYIFALQNVDGDIPRRKKQ
jgi:hypothetical protein